MANIGDVVQKECEGKCQTVTQHIYQGKWFEEASAQDHVILQHFQFYQTLNGAEQYECTQCHNVTLKK